MRLSAMLSMAVPYREITGQARLADELGFDGLACSHIAGRDSFATLAALATITERVTLSTAVVPIYPRSPASMAQAAATVDDIARGRFRLGIGIGHRITMENWHGQAIGDPLAEMREYLGIARALLDGHAPDPGARWNTGFAFVGFKPRPGIPILQAALSQRMLELAAETADGVVLWACPASYVRETIVPTLAAARDRAGKSMDGFQIIASMPTAYRGEASAVLDGIRAELHRYFGLPFYRRMFRAAGYGHALDAYDDAAGFDAQKAAIGQDLLSDLCALGEESAIAAGIARYRDAGATEVLLSPVLGTEFSAVLRVAAQHGSQSHT
jgi:alkanesulfonate monooxygenase SsuD/methylene tetrahydromethanopterin reductase-like flavin-dependent oxidoreductase (luciferase family)